MTAVAEALKKTTSYKPRSPEVIKGELAKIQERRKRMFHVETELATALSAHETELQAELSSHGIFKGGETLDVLDPAVLRWRHRRAIGGLPVPQLALISMVQYPSSSMLFKIDENGARSLNSASSTLGGYYGDVTGAFRRRDSVRSESLSWTFHGVIPEKTRDLIYNERGRFEDIYLLAEAPLETWVHVQNRKTRRELAKERWDRLAALDPIVLGFGAKKLWVIDVFDPTPVEQYLLSEFTTKQIGIGSKNV